MKIGNWNGNVRLVIVSLILILGLLSGVFSATANPVGNYTIRISSMPIYADDTTGTNAVPATPYVAFEKTREFGKFFNVGPVPAYDTNVAHLGYDYWLKSEAGPSNIPNETQNVFQLEGTTTSGLQGGMFDIMANIREDASARKPSGKVYYKDRLRFEVLGIKYAYAGTPYVLTNARLQKHILTNCCYPDIPTPLNPREFSNIKDDDGFLPDFKQSFDPSTGLDISFEFNASFYVANALEDTAVRMLLFIEEPKGQPILRGDLNDNGQNADAGDLVLMKRASIGEIQADSRYDLNNNRQNADAGDLVLMKRASIGEINL